MCVICENNYDYETKHIHIRDCKDIIEVPDTLLGAKFINIINCPNLRSIPKTLVNLERLDIYNCPRLMSIPSLPMLIDLDIQKCNMLYRIPALDRLENLYLFDCENLTKMYERYDMLDWFEYKNCPIEVLPLYAPNLSFNSPNDLN